MEQIESKQVNFLLKVLKRSGFYMCDICKHRHYSMCESDKCKYFKQGKIYDENPSGNCHNKIWGCVGASDICDKERNSPCGNCKNAKNFEWNKSLVMPNIPWD